MKFFTKAAVGLCMAASMSFSATAAGWPADYEGVMLQGFYWDSYTDTKWTNLESQADELSQYFKLIWVPNSGYCGGSNNMGYMPIYWFTNHNSSFGTEAQLISMINTFKQKGTGIIADVVINHRNGRTNWTDFPAEEWNGQTWFIGTDGICRNDEVANASGQAKPTGNYDTGENFDGARDLDHTNANVQNNCKNYCKALLEKYGYTGFRYDMVKGYSGQYNKIYNQYSKPTFSVGEYWDGNYDAVAAWIEATGKESAAFDFPGKYAINEAFSSNDMSKLVWKANGTTDQPAGMIHFGYSQYAVTFVDNHDTYRDGSKFNGNIVAANAFILMSPGTPCVFLPHYKANKAAIQTLINIRNAVGIHNNSAVTVLQASRDCYMAEVTGKNGKAVVKIGSSMSSPSGYTNSDIKASGNGYCVWTKTEVQGGGGGGGQTSSAPSSLYLMGNLAQGSWQTNVGVTMTKNGDKFTADNVELVAVTGETKAFFTFVTALGSTGASTEWDTTINGSDRYGAATKDASVSVGGSAAMKLFAAGVDASSAYSWGIEPGKYSITADFATMTITVAPAGQGGGGGGQGSADAPSQLYILGNLDGASWVTNQGVTMTKEGDCFVARNVKLGAPAESTYGSFYFTLVTSLGGDWDAFIMCGDRYGAPTKDLPLTPGTEGAMKKYTLNVDASSAQSWKIPAGTYDITADFAKMTVKAAIPQSGVESIEASAEDVAPVYYNLQGVRVSDPAPGLYIVVRGSKVTKEHIR